MEPMSSEEFIDFAEEQQMAVKLLRDLKLKHQQLQNDHVTAVRNRITLEAEVVTLKELQLENLNKLNAQVKTKVCALANTPHFLVGVVLILLTCVQDEELQSVKNAMEKRGEELQTTSESLASIVASNEELQTKIDGGRQELEQLKGVLDAAGKEHTTGIAAKDKQMKALEREVNKLVR
jgi:hypothetical protein